MNIRGHGKIGPSGIETFRGGHGRPTPQPTYGAYSPSSTYSPSPSPSPSYSPSPAYVSSTIPVSAAFEEELSPYEPSYEDSPYYGEEELLEDEPGYSYPVPANPLVLPTKVPVLSGISLSHSADSGYVPDTANGANYVEPKGIR